MIITGILFVYVFILVEGSNIAFHSSGITWQSYLRSCGYETFKAHPQQAKQDFNRDFFRKGVTWDGYVVRVSYNEDNPLSINYHSASLLVKMEEDDKPGEHGPDIGLSIAEI